MTHCIRLVALLLISLQGLAQQQNTWSGDNEYKTSIAVRAGRDDDNRTSYGLDAQLPLPGYNVLTLEWFESSGRLKNEMDFDNYYVNISSITYDRAQHSLRIGVAHYQLAVDNDKASNIYASVDHQLNNAVSLAAMLANSLDDSVLYTEFSARYQW